MTIGTAFRLSALAIIATTQTAHLNEAPAFPDTAAAGDTARESSSASFPVPRASAAAEAVLHHTQAELSARDVVAAVDIWDRMRAGFGIRAAGESSVQTHIDRFRKQAFFVEQLLQRSEPYLLHVLTRLEERGLPAELALLPVIESAYDPFARSPAGAAGIWQFMPATADDVGLRRDWWFDGRRDILAATEAALDYLTALQQHYDGDWLLALAAYNAGSARINQAIRINRGQGKPVDFWHLQLPKETRDYVPKLIALRTIVSSPGRYGVTLPDLASTDYFTRVEIHGQIDLQVVARLTDTSLDELQRLNPGLTRAVTPPGDSHQLLVPSGTADRFLERLARLPAGQRVQSVRYRIRPGDTLSVIALNSRTTVERLRKINQLEGSRIIAGKVLIVPVAEHDENADVALQGVVGNG